MNPALETATPAASRYTPAKVLKLLWRITVLAVITFGFGYVLNKSAEKASASPTPAGFLRGALHGALMPGAMPTLLLGKDVKIYADNNTGRTYKLGYTAGVNACGALFFGAFYFRLNKLRKKYASRSSIAD